MLSLNLRLFHLQEGKNNEEKYIGYCTFSSDTAVPSVPEPVSTPKVNFCVYAVVSYNNRIVNGHLFTTTALPCLSKCFTLPYLSVGIRGCPLISNTYTITGMLSKIKSFSSLIIFLILPFDIANNKEMMLCYYFAKTQLQKLHLHKT